MIEEFEALTREDQDAAAELAHDLSERQVELVTLADPRYPRTLRDLDAPPPFLFMWGNRALLDEPGVGMCGSRNASDRGLECARRIGRAVAARGVHVISGYAKGVDTETHLGALESGAGTVIVLAEGILRFRRKRVFDDVPFDEHNVLVISQFSPHAAWSAGAAMARNSVIVALGSGLLVIEAGESGGTLDAGLQALGLKRPVFAISFAEDPPAGNELLIRRGARPLRTSREAALAVDALLTHAPGEQQLGLDEIQ